MTYPANLPAVSLNDALKRVAGQLSELQTRGLAIQGALGDVIRHNIVDGDTMARLQDLDRLTQELEGLSTLVIGLSNVADQSRAADVAFLLGAVQLDSLRDKLHGHRPLKYDGEPEIF